MFIKQLPPPKDKRWFNYAIIGTLISTTVFIFNIIVILGSTIEIVNFFAILALLFVINVILALFGFFNLEYLLFSTLAGFLAGLISMGYSFSTSKGGWEGLIGFLLFIQVLVLGFVIGLVVELGLMVYQKVKSKGGR